MPISPARVRRSLGFTLVELLLVVSLIGFVSLPLILSYQTARANQALASSVEQVAGTLRSVRIFAREAREQKEWGLKRASETSYVVFTSGSGGVATQQEYQLEPGVTFDGTFNITFEIGTGNTQAAQIRLRSEHNEKSARIDVLETGIVETQILP